MAKEFALALLSCLGIIYGTNTKIKENEQEREKMRRRGCVLQSYCPPLLGFWRKSVPIMKLEMIRTDEKKISSDNRINNLRNQITLMIISSAMEIM